MPWLSDRIKNTLKYMNPITGPIRALKDAAKWTQDKITGYYQPAGGGAGNGGGGGSAGNSIKLKDIGDAYFGGETIVDIVRDYKWHTGLSVDEPVSHVPRIILREFELANSSLWAQATRKISPGRMLSDNPYQSLYTCTATGRSLILPYLTDQVWEETLSWEPMEANGNGGDKSGGDGIVGMLMKGIGYIGKVAEDINDTANQLTNAAPATVENNGFQWVGNEVTDIETKFYIINANTNPESWWKNYKLCQYFIASTLHDQLNTTKAVPPPIYTLYVPGTHYSPASTIEKLSIKQIGSVMPYNALLKMSETGGGGGAGAFTPEDNQFYIPDAWEITIGFKDLVMPSRQTHFYGMNTRRLNFQAITPPGSGQPLDTSPYVGNELQRAYSAEGNASVYGSRSAAELFTLNDVNEILGASKSPQNDQSKIPVKNGGLTQ